MSDREAEREAQRRWGNEGAAWHHAYAKKNDGYHCLVGMMRGDIRDFWQVLGRGPDWESAFRDAIARGH